VDGQNLEKKIMLPTGTNDRPLDGTKEFFFQILAVHPSPPRGLPFLVLRKINENDKKFKNSNPLRFMFVMQLTIREN
jgi:hypothetical protein